MFLLFAVLYVIPHFYLHHIKGGSTALIHASSNGHLPVVQWLVQSGADIEAKDDVSIFDVYTVRRSVCYPSFLFTL